MIQLKEVSSSTDWENFLLEQEESNFLQSWYWGEFHKNLRQKIQRTGFYKKYQRAGCEFKKSKFRRS